MCGGYRERIERRSLVPHDEEAVYPPLQEKVALFPVHMYLVPKEEAALSCPQVQRERVSSCGGTDCATSSFGKRESYAETSRERHSDI